MTPAPALAAPATLDLGPTTEARFALAFAATATITRKAAAALLGIDPVTLDGLVDGRLLRAVRRGKLRAYTERDLRAYLTQEAPECPSTASPAPGSGSMISSSKVVAFTARPARLRVVPPKR